MIKPQSNPSRYYKLLHQKRETELFLSGLRLHIFSELETWQTAKTVAEKTGLNERNLTLYLNAMASIGILKRRTLISEILRRATNFLMRTVHYIWENVSCSGRT